MKAAIQAHDRISANGKIPGGDQTDMTGVAVKHHIRRIGVVNLFIFVQKVRKIRCGCFPVHPDGTGDVAVQEIFPVPQIHQKQLRGMKITG